MKCLKRNYRKCEGGEIIQSINKENSIENSVRSFKQISCLLQSQFNLSFTISFVINFYPSSFWTVYCLLNCRYEFETTVDNLWIKISENPKVLCFKSLIKFVTVYSRRFPFEIEQRDGHPAEEKKMNSVWIRICSKSVGLSQ